MCYRSRSVGLIIVIPLDAQELGHCISIEAANGNQKLTQRPPNDEFGVKQLVSISVRDANANLTETSAYPFNGTSLCVTHEMAET